MLQKILVELSSQDIERIASGIEVHVRVDGRYIVIKADEKAFDQT